MFPCCASNARLTKTFAFLTEGAGDIPTGLLSDCVFVQSAGSLISQLLTSLQRAVRPHHSSPEPDDPTIDQQTVLRRLSHQAFARLHWEKAIQEEVLFSSSSQEPSHHLSR